MRLLLVIVALVILAITDFGLTSAVLGDYDKRTRLAENGLDAVAALFNRENVSNEFEIKDVQIGHSYFIAKKSEAKNETERDEIFKMKMQYEVVPILEEYVKDGILINDFGGKPIKEYIGTLKS